MVQLDNLVLCNIPPQPHEVGGSMLDTFDLGMAHGGIPGGLMMGISGCCASHVTLNVASCCTKNPLEACDFYILGIWGAFQKCQKFLTFLKVTHEGSGKWIPGSLGEHPMLKLHGLHLWHWKRRSQELQIHKSTWKRCCFNKEFIVTYFDLCSTSPVSEVDSRVWACVEYWIILIILGDSKICLVKWHHSAVLQVLTQFDISPSLSGNGRKWRSNGCFGPSLYRLSGMTLICQAVLLRNWRVSVKDQPRATA